MSICSNCGATYPDDAGFCPVCGTPANQAAGAAYNSQPYAPADPKDHTSEFTQQDVADNKLIAAITYFGIIGVLAAAIINKDSAYVMFHIRQNLKLFILQSLSAIIALAVITAPLVCIFEVILAVVEIVGFVWTMQGKSKELPIVASFGFLN